MDDVLGRKQTIYGALQGCIALGLPKAAVNIRLIQFQVTFINMNASFRTVILHLEGVEDVPWVPIG